mgnify:CR=1
MCDGSFEKRTNTANSRRGCMAKILGWAVLIIFIIGLLVVLGVFKLIIPG